MPSESQDFLTGGFLEDQEGFFSNPTLLDDGLNVGIGRNLDRKPLRDHELNIIEDDLTARGIQGLPLDEKLTTVAPVADVVSANAGRRILQEDVFDAEQQARSVIGDDLFDQLNPARQAFLTNMAFNVGATGLAGFTGMIAGIEEGVQTGDFSKATKEFFDSVRSGNRPDPVTGIKKNQVAPRRLAAEAFLLKEGQFPKDLSGEALIPKFTGPGQIQPQFITVK